MKTSPRQATLKRQTKETKVELALDLDGRGSAQLQIGIPFLEHMLTLLAGHSLIDLRIQAKGDLEVDQHHLAEDIGIALGQALAKACADKHGMVRYGWAIMPMDEARVQVVLDLSGRPWLDYSLQLRRKHLGGFDTELVPEFFRAFANNAALTLHIDQQCGGNSHHLVEAAFKGVGRALRQAVALDPRQRGIPSTKGRL